MICAYGITQQGAYHIKNDVVCQDAHAIVRCGENMMIAAVADGLGSEKYSDVASNLAVNFSTNYCAEHVKEESSEEYILGIIKTAFDLSQREIEQTAIENKHEVDQYDTTLSLAILIHDVLYYGHSGDSGIIALTTDGLYCKVTEQQRDQDGCVFPLFLGEEKWVFGKYEKRVVSVFLATDGMYEMLFPIYIRNEEINIYVALAKFFMDPQVLNIEEAGEEAAEEKVRQFIGGISESQLNDDKTVVVMLNTSIQYDRQPDSYYAEPDWQELKRKYDEAWKKAAYPHLFRNSS